MDGCFHAGAPPPAVSACFSRLIRAWPCRSPIFVVNYIVIMTYVSITNYGWGGEKPMMLPAACDIAIIGAGPVGLFLANLLGLESVCT